jgi:hypothetical protein
LALKVKQEDMLPLQMEKNVSVGLPQILMQQKNTNLLYVPRWTTKCVNTVYSFRWNFQLMAANLYCGSITVAECQVMG